MASEASTERYILTILKVDDKAWKDLPKPWAPSPRAWLHIRLEPLIYNPNEPGAEEFMITGLEYEELRANSPKGDLMCISDMSGSAGGLAGVVTIPRELLEKFRRERDDV